MELFSEVGVDLLGFFVKAVIVVVAFGIILSLIASVVVKNKSKSHIEIENLNEKFKEYHKVFRSQLADKKLLKLIHKEEKKAKKSKSEEKNSVYYLEFEGDIKASDTEGLRETVTAILSVAQSTDEIVVNVESQGGMVHSYGLAAAQLLRIKQAKIPLTICVDKVAASGGYMMACVGDKILAGPFAILGSIGVLAQVPNFNKVLKKNDIEYEEITAGEYKRTLSLFGQITEKGKEKFTEQIVDTHNLFKDFVKAHRPQLDISAVATGEYWYGQRALDKKLVDEIKTSDEYLLSKHPDFNIFKVSLKEDKQLLDKINDAVGKISERVIDKVLSKNHEIGV